MSYNPKDQRLTPLTSKPEAFEFGAIDTETIGNEATYDSGSALFKDEYYQFSDARGLVNYITQPRFKGIRWFAHNASYDLGVLFQYLPPTSNLLFLNGKILLAKLHPAKNRTHYICDSWRLAANLSLKSIGDKIGLPKFETPSYLLPPELTESKEYQENTSEQVSLETYLKRDTEIVYKYIELFQEQINALGGQVKNTLASTAMDLYRRSYLNENYFTPFEARNDFARTAYYGGRVEPYQLGELSDVNIYDINSLYPYVMHNFEYPHPNFLKGMIHDGTIKHIYKYEGVSEVTIYIPPSFTPLLPFRANGRLYFPAGTIRGTWTNFEIREAIKRGCRVYQIHTLLYSERTCKPFESYVTELYNLRLSLKANSDPREHVIKILLNSLYGKFGQRRDSALEEIITENEFSNLEDMSGYTPMILAGQLYFRKPVEMNKQANYINTLWASHITAYARFTLFEYMETLSDSLLYVDTDSLFTTSELPVSPDLGGLKMLHNSVDVLMLGAKCYKILDKDKTLETKVRGVPHAYQEKYLTSHEATYMKSLGFFEAASRKLNPSQWVEIQKELHSLTPKRFYSKHQSNQKVYYHSRPLTPAEIDSQPMIDPKILMSNLLEFAST